jgi:hypothetical protein
MYGTNGKVGIGTSTPGAKLTIKQPGINWGDGLRLVGSDNVYWDIVKGGIDNGIFFGYNGETNAKAWINQYGDIIAARDIKASGTICDGNNNCIGASSAPQTLGTSGNYITLTNSPSVIAPYATNAGRLNGKLESQLNVQSADNSRACNADGTCETGNIVATGSIAASNNLIVDSPSGESRFKRGESVYFFIEPYNSASVQYVRIGAYYPGSGWRPLVLQEGGGGGGNVGIDVTIPAEKLDVRGNIKVRGGIKLDGSIKNALGSRDAYFAMPSHNDCNGAEYPCPSGYHRAGSWHVGDSCDGGMVGEGGGYVIKRGWMQLCAIGS